MERPKVKHRSELRADGWHVIEEPMGPVNAPLPPAAAPVAAVITITQAQEVLRQHGFVAIPMEDVEALPATHRNKLLKIADAAPAAIEEAELVTRIQDAATMEELTELVGVCTSPAVIAAAEERAAQLTEGK